MIKVFKFLILLFLFASFSEAKICNCRLPDPNKESANLVPSAVVLRENDKSYCMGFIVNENEIVTSADCVQSRSIENLNVITGRNKLKNVDPNRVYHVDSILVHPLYKNSKSNNIAIIRLKKEIEFQKAEVEIGCLELSYNNAYLNDELLTSIYRNQTDSFEYSYFKITERLPIEKKFLHGKATKKDRLICKGKTKKSITVTFI